MQFWLLALRRNSGQLIFLGHFIGISWDSDWGTVITIATAIADNTIYLWDSIRRIIFISACLIVPAFSAWLSLFFFRICPLLAPVKTRVCYVCLTNKSDFDETSADVRVFGKDLQLFIKLFPLNPVFFRFRSNSCHKVGIHCNYTYRKKDVNQFGDELHLNHFDRNVVDKTFQGNLDNNISWDSNEGAW